MKILKKIVFILLIVFIGIQFIPTAHNQSNTVLETDLTDIFDVSEDIQKTLKISCYECHSNTTNYPWYSQIQPMSWFLEKHINEGKEELNFSVFANYSNRRQKSKIKSIISQIENNEMPLTSYTIMHRGARLSETDKKQILDWFNTINNNL